MRSVPRIYRSYEDFERDELKSVEKLDVTIDEMLDELFSDGLDAGPAAKRGAGGEA